TISAGNQLDRALFWHRAGTEEPSGAFPRIGVITAQCERDRLEQRRLATAVVSQQHVPSGSDGELQIFEGSDVAKGEPFEGPEFVRGPRLGGAHRHPSGKMVEEGLDYLHGVPRGMAD